MNRKQRLAQARIAARAGGGPRLDELLAGAVRSHKAMRLADAERLYRQALAIDPANADALHGLGVIAAQSGRHDEAIRLIGKAVDANPGLAAAHGNLGLALRALGRGEAAVQSYRRAVELAHNSAEAHYSLGAALQGIGRHEEAVGAYRRALELQPGHAAAAYNQGLALQALGRDDEAVATYQRAIALNPQRAQAHNNLGVTLLRLGRAEEAAAACRRAVALQPDYGEARSNLGLALQDLGRDEEAVEVYQRLLERAPDYAVGHNNLGVLLQKLGRTDEALAVYETTLAISPDYAVAHNGRGLALQTLGRADEAIAAYRRAISLDPNLAAAGINLAIALQELGEAAEAMNAVDQALTIDPTSAHAWFTRSDLKTFTPDDPDIGRMEALLAAADEHRLSLVERLDLEFALGKAFMDIGDAERAFAHLDQGNRRMRASFRYDIEDDLRQFAAIARAYPPEVLRQAGGDPSELPIFVVGMPRSGTTLVEQILAAHPEVHGAGELSDLETLAGDDPGQAQASERLGALGRAYVDRISALAPGKRRVVDKMPANFRFTGLIRTALPNARIIHCRRDPIDVGLSCYARKFGGRQDFAYDLRELGLYYRGYERLMAHWRALLPADRFIEVRYEAVVGDLEGEARRLIGFCGLGWDPACLAFHAVRRPVRTASAGQVRRPIYNSSVGRWAPYAAHLKPLIKALGPDRP
jgi:tetratricopeptide (TPR) repeat protein